jgi:nucleoside-diphosphate kinase
MVEAARERTFIMIKPDGVQRGLVGPIISRFETKGFKLVGMKLTAPGKEMFEKHYSDLSSKGFFAGLVAYASSGPVVAMVWEGHNVVATGRKMLGATRPDDSAPGTIRGDFCIDVGRNVIHGSDSVDSANKEIELWFGKENLTNCKRLYLLLNGIRYLPMVRRDQERRKNQLVLLLSTLRPTLTCLIPFDQQKIYNG